MKLLFRHNITRQNLINSANVKGREWGKFMPMGREEEGPTSEAQAEEASLQHWMPNGAFNGEEMRCMMVSELRQKERERVQKELWELRSPLAKYSKCRIWGHWLKVADKQYSCQYRHFSRRWGCSPRQLVHSQVFKAKQNRDQFRQAFSAKTCSFRQKIHWNWNTVKQQSWTSKTLSSLYFLLFISQCAWTPIKVINEKSRESTIIWCVILLTMAQVY